LYPQDSWLRLQQAAADEAKKLVDAAALAAERLVDATKEAEADKASLLYLTD
jgi:hypothetical protein